MSQVPQTYILPFKLKRNIPSTCPSLPYLLEKDPIERRMEGRNSANIVDDNQDNSHIFEDTQV